MLFRSHVMHCIKVLAQEMNCPVLVLSPLTRSPDKREDHRPRLNDIRNYREVVDLCDNVLFLYRDAYYRHLASRSNLHFAEVLVAKQANGPLGLAEVIFLPEYGKFEPMVGEKKFTFDDTDQDLEEELPF